MSAIEIIRREQLRLLDIATEYVALAQRAQAEANQILDENARLNEALAILSETSLEAEDANENETGEDQPEDPREPAPCAARPDVDQQDEQPESPTEEGDEASRPRRGRRPRVDRGPEADRRSEVGEAPDGGSASQDAPSALIAAAARVFNLSPALILRGESGPVIRAKRAIVLAGIREGFTPEQIAAALEITRCQCDVIFTLASEQAREPGFEAWVQQVQRELTSGKA